MSLVLPIPTLRTDRLILRPMAAGDVVHEQAFYGSDRAAFVGGPMHPADTWRYVATYIGHWHLRGYGTFAVEEAASGTYCGHVGPWFPEGWPEPEISWTLMAGAEGRGIAFEAATAARDWAYRCLGWTTSISLIDADNRRSALLAERLGARREGVFEHHKYGALEIWRHPGPEVQR